ncbi:MAG: hypothetical protein JWN56_711 [Sphingobacteriales bacterium]|nr:hypothetical protein [Sphingobacteriales bacterium]
MTTKYLLFLFIALLACLVTIKLNKLTTFGAITGFIIALAIFSAFGFPGLAFLATFFITATLATSWKKQTKQVIYRLEKHQVKRDANQVLANGGVAAIAALLSIVLPSFQDWFLLMMVASFSSATADTISSELGNVYGTRFFNILSFKPDMKGENGVVSLEGLFFGFIGSFFIAIVFSIVFCWDYRFLIIIVSGTIGNLADSILGATLERKGILGNNQVNFLNTLIAALSSCLFLY